MEEGQDGRRADFAAHSAKRAAEWTAHCVIVEMGRTSGQGLFSFSLGLACLTSLLDWTDLGLRHATCGHLLCFEHCFHLFSWKPNLFHEKWRGCDPTDSEWCLREYGHRETVKYLIWLQQTQAHEFDVKRCIVFLICLFPIFSSLHSLPPKLAQDPYIPPGSSHWTLHQWNYPGLAGNFTGLPTLGDGTFWADTSMTLWWMKVSPQGNQTENSSQVSASAGDSGRTYRRRFTCPLERLHHLFMDPEEPGTRRGDLIPTDYFVALVAAALGRLPQPVHPDIADATWLELGMLLNAVGAGRPSHLMTPLQLKWDMEDMLTWHNRDEPPPLLQPELRKWRHWKPRDMKIEEPTTQRALSPPTSQVGRSTPSSLCPLCGTCATYGGHLGALLSPRDGPLAGGREVSYFTTTLSCLWRSQEEGIHSHPMERSGCEESPQQPGNGRGHTLQVAAGMERLEVALQDLWPPEPGWGTPTEGKEAGTGGIPGGYRHQTTAEGSCSQQRSGMGPGRRGLLPVDGRDYKARGYDGARSGTTQSDGLLHLGPGTLPTRLQCSLQWPPACAPQGDPLHHGDCWIAGMANKDSFGSEDTTPPSPTHLPQVQLLWKGLVVRFGSPDTQADPGGTVQRYGLPDTHSQQRLQWCHLPPQHSGPRSEMAERSTLPTRRQQGADWPTHLALIQGIHPRLRLRAWCATHPAPVPGQLAHRIHGRRLHQGETQRGSIHLAAGSLQSGHTQHETRPWTQRRPQPSRLGWTHPWPWRRATRRTGTSGHPSTDTGQ